MGIWAQTFQSNLYSEEALWPGHVWAERRYVIDGRANSFNGPFLTANVAFVREPIDRGADNAVATIVNMCAVQSLKTTVSHAIFARCPGCDPGPAMWISQSRDEARIMLWDRMLPSFRRSPGVEPLLPLTRHGMTKSQIDFASMPLYMGWGGSEKKMQSKPVRYLFLDEPEQYADLVKEAEDRTTRFENSRTIYSGTPGDAAIIRDGDHVGGGILDAEFRRGHQAYWKVFCMGCAKLMFIDHGVDYLAGLTDHPGLRWQTDTDEPWFECEHCHHQHFDIPHVRRHFACNGEWHADNPGAAAPAVQRSGKRPRAKLSFTWPCLIFPTGFSWSELKTEYRQAQAELKAGLPDKMRKLVTKRWGKPFDYAKYEDKWLKEGSLYVPKDKWPEEIDRFIGCDVQKEVLYAVCRAVSAAGASRLLTARKVPDFEALRELQQEMAVGDARVLVDSGYRETEVIRAAARYGWTPIKGTGNESRVKELKWKRPGGTVQQLWKPMWAQQDGDGHEFERIDWRLVPPHLKKTVSEVLKSADVVQRMHTAGLTQPFYPMLFASEGAMNVLHALMSSVGDMPDWQYPKGVPQEYLDHLSAARHERLPTNKGMITRWVYKKGGDHYLACERMIVVAMVAAGYLQPTVTIAETKENVKP